jgi:hypothetical protein
MRLNRRTGNLATDIIFRFRYRIDHLRIHGIHHLITVKDSSRFETVSVHNLNPLQLPSDRLANVIQGNKAIVYRLSGSRDRVTSTRRRI